MGEVRCRGCLPWLVLLAVLWPGLVRAGQVVSGLTVVFAGELGQPRQSRDVAAYPGMRFGLEVVAEGAPKGAHVVLEARLIRPGDAEGAPPIRWLIPARIGYPVQSVWEFAYDWEVQPGVWTMEVVSGDASSGPVSFTVVAGQAPAQSQASASGRVSNQGNASVQTQETAGDIQKSKDKPANKNADKSQAEKPRPEEAQSGKAQPGNTQPEKVKPDKAHSEIAQPDKPQSGKATLNQSPAEKKQPDKVLSDKPLTEKPAKGTSAKNRVGLPAQQRVFVVMGGSFSEEGRAMWMAALLKGQGITACIREHRRDGRKYWGVVLGWKNSIEEARAAKEDLSRKVKDVLVTGMSVGELEKGLSCH